MKPYLEKFINYCFRENKGGVYETRSTRVSLQNNYFFCTTLKDQSSRLQSFIKYQGLQIWNSLNLEIKKSNSIKFFTSKLKPCLLQNYDIEEVYCV